MKMSRGFFFVVVVCLFVCFHFLKPLKFVWGLPKWTIFTGKSIFHPGKKLGKVTLSPWENIPLTPLLCCKLIVSNECDTMHCGKAWISSLIHHHLNHCCCFHFPLFFLFPLSPFCRLTLCTSYPAVPSPLKYSRVFWIFMMAWKL